MGWGDDAMGKYFPRTCEDRVQSPRTEVKLGTVVCIWNFSVPTIPVHIYHILHIDTCTKQLYNLRS